LKEENKNCINEFFTKKGIFWVKNCVFKKLELGEILVNLQAQA
jgi:hypothetical protein